MNCKSIKVIVSGIRKFSDGSKKKLKPIIMSLDKFVDFLDDIDCSSITAKNGTYIDGENNEAFAEAVIGSMMLNNGKITIDCGTTSCDDENEAEHDSYEDIFTCKVA